MNPHAERDLQREALGANAIFRTRSRLSRVERKQRCHRATNTATKLRTIYCVLAEGEFLENTSTCTLMLYLCGRTLTQANKDETEVGKSHELDGLILCEDLFLILVLEWEQWTRG